MTDVQLIPIDVIVATNVAAKVDHLLSESALLARSMGTDITLGQVLAAALASAWESMGRPLERDEFIGIYDYVEQLQAEHEDTTLQGEAVATVTRGPGGSPADTADARSPEEAHRLAEKWAERVNDIAFGSITQEDLGG